MKYYIEIMAAKRAKQKITSYKPHDIKLSRYFRMILAKKLCKNYLTVLA